MRAKQQVEGSNPGIGKLTKVLSKTLLPKQYEKSESYCYITVLRHGTCCVLSTVCILNARGNLIKLEKLFFQISFIYPKLFLLFI